MLKIVKRFCCRFVKRLSILIIIILINFCKIIWKSRHKNAKICYINKAKIKCKKYPIKQVCNNYLTNPKNKATF